MTTEELKEAAQRGLDKIGVKVDNYQVFLNDNFHYGAYYSVEEDTFYRTDIGERGYYKKEALSGLEEALSQIYHYVTLEVAARYASKHHDRRSGLDWRRTMHAKQLELLRQIGESYYIQGQKNIEGVLGVHPYVDKPRKTIREWIAGLWK